MKTKLAILFSVLCMAAFGQAPFTNIWLPGTWPASEWWTNAIEPTEIASSNAWQAVNENFRRASNSIALLSSETGTNAENLTSVSNALETLEGSLPDAATNAMLNSFRVAVIVSNSVVIPAGATNVLGWVTNLAGVDFTYPAVTFTNLGNWATNAPQLLFSSDGTNYWSGTAVFVTNSPIQVAWYSGSMVGSIASNSSTYIVQIPLGGLVSNVVAYSMVRPDLFGRTNATYGEILLAQDPTQPSQVATKNYVDSLYLFTSWWSAGQDIQVNSYNVDLSPTWQEGTDILTNTTSYHLRFLGVDMIRATASQPVSLTNVSVSVTSATNITVKVPTNGLSAAPQLEFSHYLFPVVWAWLTNAATIASTNYSWTFKQPYPDAGFIMVMVPASSPNVLTLAGLVNLPPNTVTNSTNSTLGYGAGLVCADSNYVYVSVATNLWRRAALSSW